MATALKGLIASTGCKQRDSEDRQEYLIRLVKAVSKLSEDEWNKLSDEDQEWSNGAVTSAKAGKPIIDPDEDDDEPAPKKSNGEG
jgi:hypothetical protein